MSELALEDEEPEGADVPEAVLPAEFREKLREAGARNYGRMVRRLERTIEATKEERVSCPGCGRKFAIEVDDAHASNKAIELFTSISYGRLGTDSAGSAEESESLKAHEMSDEELFERRARWFADYLRGASDEERARVLERYGLSVTNGVR